MVCHIKAESIERLLAAVSHRYYGSTYPSPLTASFALTGTHWHLLAHTTLLLAHTMLLEPSTTPRERGKQLAGPLSTFEHIS